MHYLNELVANNQLTQAEANIVRKANKILGRLLSDTEAHISFGSPAVAADYLRTHYLDSQREHFLVMFLDTRNRLLKTEILFHGTIDSCSVYSRIVVQRALQYNAAAIILSHNHPTGNLDPSPSDKKVTNDIKQLLNLIDVRLLDHIIITSRGFYSFAENFLL